MSDAPFPLRAGNCAASTSSQDQELRSDDLDQVLGLRRFSFRTAYWKLKKNKRSLLVSPVKVRLFGKGEYHDAYTFNPEVYHKGNLYGGPDVEFAPGSNEALGMAGMAQDALQCGMRVVEVWVVKVAAKKDGSVTTNSRICVLYLLLWPDAVPGRWCSMSRDPAPVADRGGGGSGDEAHAPPCTPPGPRSAAGAAPRTPQADSPQVDTPGSTSCPDSPRLDPLQLRACEEGRASEQYWDDLRLAFFCCNESTRGIMAVLRIVRKANPKIADIPSGQLKVRVATPRACVPKEMYFCCGAS